MKTKKLFALLLAALMLAALLPACAQSPAAASFTDMAGREITLDEPAARVVAVTPADCEILYALGAGETLVGRGTYCDWPEAVLELPEVESGQSLNVEQVIALKPDVVLMPKMSQTEEQVRALEDASAHVVVSDAQDIDGVYEAIRLIGTVTGKEAEAEELAAGMQQSFADIEAEATGDGSETIYFEVSPLEYGLWTAGGNTFMDELATMLGLTNAFADVDGWGEISQEQVIERDPDYIVTISMYFGEGPTPEEEILGRAGWQEMKAIKNGAVFNADNNEIARPGPRLVNAAEALYAFVYEAMPQGAVA
ncbi:MAG: ABC transporter substrate-binding protein [Oscillospiraceae bacterium]